MEKIYGNTTDFTLENKIKLVNIFPDVLVDIIYEEDGVTIKDYLLDYQKLSAILGGNNSNIEKYSFSWNGKHESIKLSQKPSTCTLLPLKNNSIDWDNTNNIYIEGDNLEALKLLTKTYSKKIKMIYIDPPYNTGHDFVYKDDFYDNIENYKNLMSSKSRANPELSGRFHTEWLNMMYPRLLCAKRLLTDDGVLFISMADTELKNLLNMCEEIFSKDNIEIFVWKKKSSAGNTEKILGVLTEYIVCCFNNKAKGVFNYVKLNREYKYSDEKGPYNLEGVEKSNLGTYARPTMLFDVVDPVTNVAFRPGKDLRWTIGKETFEHMIKEGKIYFDYKTNKVKRIKRPEDYEESENVFYNLLDNHGSLGTAKDELEKLLGNREIFDTPKPTQLIKHLLSIGSRQDSIVLDFFSGSATTAQAVLELNSEDGGNRKYILVQTPELLEEESEGYKFGYRNICQIGQERIKKVNDKIYNSLNDTYQNSGLFSSESIVPDSQDLGFKVFKLESTNIKPWDGNVKYDTSSIFDLNETIKDGRTNLDVAYEIMLKYGIFNMQLKEVKINNKTMYSIGDGYMIICLDNAITMDDVTAIAKQQPKCVVFKEIGLADDNVKINATYTLERLGVEDIKCI